MFTSIKGMEVCPKSNVIHVDFGKAHEDDADAGVAVCSDFRIRLKNDDLYRRLGLRSVDEIKIPGGIKALVEQEAFVIASIVKLCKLHHLKKFYLIAHSDCGAYKDDGIIFRNDSIAEKAFHIGELSKARDLLKVIMPALEIHLIYASLSGIEEIEINEAKDPGFLIAVG